MEKLKRFIGMLIKPVKVLFVEILTAINTVHGKRIFFLTSLYYSVAKVHSFQKDTLLSISQKLRLLDQKLLDKSPNKLDSLLLPAILHEVIWNEAQLDQCIKGVCPLHMPDETTDEADIRRICYSIVDITPKFLQYGRRDDMVDDLVAMFKQLPTSGEAIA